MGAFGWNEIGLSGSSPSTSIASYTFTVCPMETNVTTGLLTENTTACLAPKVYSLTTPGNFPSVTLPETKMYSLVVSVCDISSGCGKARKLIFYDKENNIGITSNPMVLVLNRLNGSFFSQQTGNITLSWLNHFENKKHSQMLSAVRPGIPGEFVSDVPNGPSTTAQRNLDLIFNINGIVSFEVSVAGGPFRQVIQGKQSVSLTLPPGLKQENTVVFSVRAWDIMSNSRTDNITTFFDTTPPEISADITLNINDENPPPNLLDFDVSRWINLCYNYNENIPLYHFDYKHSYILS